MMRVAVPPSKSITQRALVLAALSETPTTIVNPLDCDDSRALIQGLGKLGVKMEQQPGSVRVVPSQLRVDREKTLFLGNAGTAVRFVTGLSLIIEGQYVIDGNEAMQKRPMPGLLAALTDLGVRVRELGRSGCPPIELEGVYMDAADEQEISRVVLRAGGSSQELSSLLLSGCKLPRGLEVEVQGNLPSMPYVELTRAVMGEFGVEVRIESPNLFRVAPAVPRKDRFVVETDWSSASYPLAASWLTGKDVDIENLNGDSVQGDKEFPRFLTMLDGTGSRVLSMGETPDLVPGVVACALFRDGETEIVDAAHLRIKESNRIDDLARELGKLCAVIDPRPDGMIIRPSKLRGGAVLNPHNDHRLAMSFGLVSLRVPSFEIANKACVTKSYPGFWEMLEEFR